MGAAPTAPLTEESWIDRKQAAALAERRFDTIRRAEHRHKLPTRTGNGGAVLLNVGSLVAAGVLNRPGFSGHTGALDSRAATRGAWLRDGDDRSVARRDATSPELPRQSSPASESMSVGVS